MRLKIVYLGYSGNERWLEEAERDERPELVKVECQMKFSVPCLVLSLYIPVPITALVFRPVWWSRGVPRARSADKASEVQTGVSASRTSLVSLSSHLSI